MRVTIQLPNFHRQHVGQCEECQYTNDGNGGNYHRLLCKRGIWKEGILERRVDCLRRVRSVAKRDLIVNRR